MKARARFGDIVPSVARGLRRNPEAAALARELRRLAAEIRGLPLERPLVPGIEVALRLSDGAQSAAAPLVGLAAEMVADHAPDSGWRRDDLLDYVEGLGPARAADFFEQLAAAITP